MTNIDKNNTIVAIVCLIVVIVSLPYVFFSSLLLGYMISEPTIMILGFTGSFIAGGIMVLYYILMGISKKTIIYTRKGKKINVKANIFILAVVNLIIMAMSIGVLGIVVIPWTFSVIFNLIAGFMYKNYK
ncbi:hypothetical protein LCGC14_1694850 [marine sediment metagenome]|uniref:Uncharacterized protein n=1 Tax=marine sediment metagenome TaxID=412755 RepID=A0A0F9I7B3_9ZZZZ